MREAVTKKKGRGVVFVMQQAKTRKKTENDQSAVLWRFFCGEALWRGHDEKGKKNQWALGC